MDDFESMDELTRLHILEQYQSRLILQAKGDPDEFKRHMSKIRQAEDGFFEMQLPNGEWGGYLPGGYPYGRLEVEALQAMGFTITDDNVDIRYERP
jgi:hypothetical protein